MGPGARFAGEVQAGDAGRYGDLIGRVGDEITPHHMPQAAQGFTPYRDGGALALPFDEHILTRTYGWRGAQVLEQEAGLPFREVLARDFRDIRSLFGSKYNEGMRNLYRYYQENYPQLLQKPPTGGQP